MKKLFLSFATLLLGSNLVYGFPTDSQYNSTLVPVAPPVASQENSVGLIPKRTKVAPDQQPTKREPVSVLPVPLVFGDGARLAQASTDLVPIAPPENLTVETAPKVVTPQVETASYRAQVNNGSNLDSHIYSELDWLRSEIQKIRKDTAKPDTKKAWSAPRINGRIFLDSVNFIDQNAESRNENGNMQNAAGFRELRLGASGSGYDSFDYKVEFGFQNDGGRVALIDNWVGVKNMPLLGYVRVGHFKPETGLYYPMGTTNISAMEYTTSANIFGLGRKIGISSENLFANDRVRLFFGVFQSANTDLDRRLVEDNQGQIVNLRLSAAPWFAQEGKCVFHVGGHWEFVSLDSNSYIATNTTARTLSAKPGTLSWASNTLSSGNVVNGDSHRGGLELAYQNGRFSTRSELFAGSFDQGRHLYGTYVELAYFLTNDFRIYDLKSGSFGGVKMKRNFHPYQHGEWNLIDSFGAWQAVFQWSYTDMEDWRANATTGGHQNDFVAGLNWYWSPQMRWMFQYVRSNQCVGDTYSHRSQDIFATSIRYNW